MQHKIYNIRDETITELKSTSVSKPESTIALWLRDKGDFYFFFFFFTFLNAWEYFVTCENYMNSRATTNLDSVLKSKDVSLMTNVHISKLCFL